MTDCVFCDILAGRLPSSQIYQDNQCTVFVDINPINKGHMLVIPNYHATSLSELDERTGAHLFKVAQRMAAALRRSGLKCEAVNVFLADGEAAGQDVFHVHIHVVPRFAGDGFRVSRHSVQDTRIDRTELNRIAQTIKGAYHSPVGVYQAPATRQSEDTVRQQLRGRVSPESYKEIRQLWMEHSVAEDSRNIPGLMATLTEDCVYTLVNTGKTWQGHSGATQFYTELLTAFPDIKFHLQNIIIGPQGVFEEAHVTGTHKNSWLHYPATGERIEFDVVIFFPYDPTRKLFTGERIYMLMPES